MVRQLEVSNTHMRSHISDSLVKITGTIIYHTVYTQSKMGLQEIQTKKLASHFPHKAS
jgi:hypothetical protein